MLLHNARVITLDPRQPRAEAVAIAQGRIVAVGTVADCAPHAEGERIDLEGACVIPGLVDAHAHVLGLGIFLAEVNLVGCSDEDELVDRVRAWRGTAGGGWIRGFGWDQTRWPGKAFPHHAALSRALPDQPVYLTRIDGHSGFANAAALRLAGIDRTTADPPGGRIVRDASGEPTGVLVDKATELVERCLPPMSEAEREARILTAAEACARVGLTAVHDAGDDLETLATLQRLDEEGRLPLRIYAMVESKPPTLGRWLERGPHHGDRLTVRCVKLFLDGALGSRGAAFHEPYDDDPDNLGLSLIEPEPFRAILRSAHGAGFQVAVHAIGDRASTLAIEAFEELGLSGDARPRLEHAQIVRPEDVARAARLGVIASMQPTHCTSDMAWLEQRIGCRRLPGASPWRSFLEAGSCLALGSDFPIESPDPRKGLYAAITRQNEQGQPPGGFQPQERITLEQALRGFTEGAAYAAFAESERGRVAPGFRADLTVFERDPFEIETPEILRNPVLQTIVGGRTVFRA